MVNNIVKRETYTIDTNSRIITYLQHVHFDRNFLSNPFYLLILKCDKG